MRKTFFCKCGASISISASNRLAINKVFQVWLLSHSGEGHQECSRQTAINSRRRIARAEKKLIEMTGDR